MSGLRAVSLFSNCGAGDIGYRNAGFEFDVMAELDPKRLEVCLLNHAGAIGVVGDLRTTWQTVIEKYYEKSGSKRPALLSACPPCQGMSSARSGKGTHDDAAAGSKDERNLLVTVIAKVALRLRPSFVVVENVPAFLTRKVHHPKDKNPVTAAHYLISALGKYYVPFPVVADLCDFGVPQSRKRAFLTFICKDMRGLKELLILGRAPYPRPTHVPDVGTRGPISLAEALESFGLPELDAGSAETAVSEGYGGLHSVPVWDARTYAMVSAIPRASGRSAWENDTCHECGPVEVSLESVLCPTCNSPLLRPIVKESDGSYRLVKGFKSSYKRMRMDRPAATVTTASGHLGSDNTIHPTQTRLLSTAECALLQTFPSDFKWGDALTKFGHTNVREMIGEAVPPAFTKAHGQVLRSIFEGCWKAAPMSLSDDRCVKGWQRLSAAAKKDRRRDPKRYFEAACSNVQALSVINASVSVQRPNKLAADAAT